MDEMSTGRILYGAGNVGRMEKTYTKPVGFDTISLLTLRPFLRTTAGGCGRVEVVPMCS